MKKIRFLLLTVLLSLVIYSCELFDSDNGGLSTEEIINGLKTALEIGADSATNNLSALDGYYDNPLVKIPLPEEAEYVRGLITDNGLATYFNLDDEFEKVVRSINKAAEAAADSALPIFGDAITSMSISDGWSILNGTNPLDQSSSAEFDSTAATGYFKSVTYNPLTNLYAPKINNALDVDLGLGFSATDAWTTLTSSYNNTLNSSAVQAALLIAELSGNPIDLPDAIDDDLGEFCTHKALDGLFYMVGNEEKEIRKDPWAWTVDIIQKVFGEVFGTS